MKIYVVTAGDGIDSGYHIEMVTVDKNKAEAYYKCLKNIHANIEEYDDGNITVEPIWYVYQDKKKTCTRLLLQDYDDIQHIDMSDINKVRDDDNGFYNTVYVRAKDEETAKKIAIDLFSQYKAEKEGII